MDDRHPEEGGKRLFTGLREQTKVGMGRSIGQVERHPVPGDPANEPLTHRQRDTPDGLGSEPAVGYHPESVVKALIQAAGARCHGVTDLRNQPLDLLLHGVRRAGIDENPLQELQGNTVLGPLTPHRRHRHRRLAAVRLPVVVGIARTSWRQRPAIARGAL